jgi:hypothetical protein
MKPKLFEAAANARPVKRKAGMLQDGERVLTGHSQKYGELYRLVETNLVLATVVLALGSGCAPREHVAWPRLVDAHDSIIVTRPRAAVQQWTKEPDTRTEGTSESIAVFPVGDSACIGIPANWSARMTFGTSRATSWHFYSRVLHLSGNL